MHRRRDVVWGKDLLRCTAGALVRRPRWRSAGRPLRLADASLRRLLPARLLRNSTAIPGRVLLGRTGHGDKVPKRPRATPRPPFPPPPTRSASAHPFRLRPPGPPPPTLSAAAHPVRLRPPGPP